MKKHLFILNFLFFLCLPGLAFAAFPTHLGGFRLGDDIANYRHLIDTDTCREIPFNRYLAEGETLVQPGFKTGQIAYGLCDSENKIVRIKLKFEDSSKKFFEKLLGLYKKKLGEPSEYRGDPFQTMIAWKWSFTDGQNQRISLILQHNIMDEDEKVGTSVKLTLTSQIEKERDCYMAKFPEKGSSAPPASKKGKLSWDLFVPHE